MNAKFNLRLENSFLKDGIIKRRLDEFINNLKEIQAPNELEPLIISDNFQYIGIFFLIFIFNHRFSNVNIFYLYLVNGSSYDGKFLIILEDAILGDTRTYKIYLKRNFHGIIITLTFVLASVLFAIVSYLILISDYYYKSTYNLYSIDKSSKTRQISNDLYF